MISTRDLSLLPAPGALRRLMQALAVLDVMLEPEWQYRYYSFNANWSAGEEMGSMRDGSGDDLFSLFDSRGCFLKGFAHESPMTPYRVSPPAVWPGVLDGVPEQWAASLREPAFKMSDTTFAIWRSSGDDAWHCGSIAYPEGMDPDGSASLLSPFDGLPATYRVWAEEYYERDVPLRAVSHVYEHRSLTVDLLEQLGCQRELAEVIREANDIGYPSTPPA